MGADYLSAHLWLRPDSPLLRRREEGYQFPDPPDFDVAEITEELLAAMDEEGESTVPAARSFIRDLLDSNVLLGRDSAWSKDGEWTMIESGGMSWGDPPTDACDAMWTIASFPQSVLDFYGISLDPPVISPIRITAGSPDIGIVVESPDDDVVDSINILLTPEGITFDLVENGIVIASKANTWDEVLADVDRFEV